VYIGDTEYTERQVAIGRFSVVTSAALAFSASIGGMVAYFVSWRAMLVGYGLLALVPAALMFSLGAGRPPRSVADEPAGRFADFLSDRWALLVYLLIFGEGFLCWGAVYYLGNFARRRHGLDQLQIGLLIALFGIGTMVGGSLMAPLRRSLSENAVGGTGGALMAAAFLALIPHWPWPAFAASMLVLGLGYVGLHSTLQVRGTEISVTARGKAFSLFAFSLFAGVAAGTALLGRLVDAGRDDTMLGISGIGLALTGAVAACVAAERSVTLEALVAAVSCSGPGQICPTPTSSSSRRAGWGSCWPAHRDAELPRASTLTGLEDALGRRLLVATDHEGGRIIMLGRSVTIFPDNLAAGTAGEINFVNRQGLFEGRELRRLGVDVNFSPVLDVLTERYSPNIGIRSYGKDPAVVSRYGAARILGMQSAGVSACAKHFPGKCHAPLDAHLGLPVIGSDWAEMHATHLPPFLAAIDAGVDCIMTSHPLYPRLDPSPRTPATFSRLIVEEYLRGEIGYRGVIVCDDLEMGAIGEICPVGEATVRAAKAGHDLLLVCHTPAASATPRRASRACRLVLCLTRAREERRAPRRAPGQARASTARARPERDGEPRWRATRADFGDVSPVRRALNGALSLSSETVVAGRQDHRRGHHARRARPSPGRWRPTAWSPSSRW
jgi:beta-glucosidase-like glycosyl hydrolase